MLSIICSVRGCHNNWIKRIAQFNQRCYEHNVKRSDCCGVLYDLHPPPPQDDEEEHLRQWRKALNLKCSPKRSYVCSYHFMDGEQTDERTPLPRVKARLRCSGKEVPTGAEQVVRFRTSMSVSVAVDNCEDDHSHMPQTCDAETQWEDPSVSDHNYAPKSQLNLKPPTSEMGTQCVEPVP
ncbi:hypothetical protein PO909_026456 [Leuciscus waleckii]